MSHLRPILPVLRAARAAGHDVVVATGPDLARKVQRRGYRTWPIGPVSADILAPRSAQAPAGDSAAHLRRSASTMVGQPGAARARALLARASRWAPDLVLHAITEVAGAEVAALTGASEIVVGPVTGEVGPAEALLPADHRRAGREPAHARPLPRAGRRPLSRPPRSGPGPRPTAFADVRPLRPELDGPQSRLPLRAQRLRGQTTVLLSLGRHGVSER